MMLNICFSADHELFFGQNKVSEEQVFIQPTYRLMEVLEQYNVPLCLMTDVCSVLRYRELRIDSEYPDLMEEQLRHAVARGHDVQLHIHSHWLTSHYINGCWDFNPANYRLHSFGFDPTDPHSAPNIIADGKKYLLDLLKPLDPEYDCIAFRAGGWCIQPEQELLEALVAAKIRIDTTIYAGGYDNNPIKFFDFRGVPTAANWWIAPRKGLNYEASRSDAHVFEVPIGSYSCPSWVGIKRLMHKKFRRRLRDSREASRGTSIDSIGKNRYQLFTQKVVNFLNQPILFTYDAACLEVMLDLVGYYLKRYDTVNNEIFVSMIGHPKVLTHSSYEEIGKFCAKITAEKSEQVRFIRFRDIPL